MTACLDQVEGLGSYLELERLLPDSGDRDAAVDGLLALLEDLGVSRRALERRSYLELADGPGSGGVSMEKQGRRERNKIRCRQRILRASRPLFSAKGYEETTMDDVAERSEVSKATLYNYFPARTAFSWGSRRRSWSRSAR